MFDIFCNGIKIITLSCSIDQAKEIAKLMAEDHYRDVIKLRHHNGLKADNFKYLANCMHEDIEDYQEAWQGMVEVQSWSEIINTPDKEIIDTWLENANHRGIGINLVKLILTYS